MKRLLTFLLTVLSIAASAQVKKPVTTTQRQTPTMRGLGKFKINETTTSVIDELCKELHSPLRYANNQLALDGITQDSTAVYELIYRADIDPEQRLSAAPASPSGKVYYLPHYEIADLPISGLYLTFYNNVLIKIELPSPGRIPEAFEIKYGKGTVKQQSKKATCLYTRTGNTLALKDEIVTEYWYNNSIVAASTISSYHDDNCQRQIVDYMTIENPLKIQELNRRSLVVEDAADGAKIKKARKGLSDL